MLKGRKVGTLTAGITLILFGLLFLGRIIVPVLDYTFIMSLWPLVLMFLGIEVIVSYVLNKEEKMQYDGGAIVLVIFMAMFAMAMGGAEFVMEHARENIKGFYFLN